jgi:hypothetical protein
MAIRSKCAKSVYRRMSTAKLAELPKPRGNRRPSRFKQNDLKRVIRAAKDAGQPFSISIQPDGTIVASFGNDNAVPNPFDE